MHDRLTKRILAGLGVAGIATCFAAVLYATLRMRAPWIGCIISLLILIGAMDDL